MPLAVLIDLIKIFGLPGMIFVIWHFDNKRRDKELTEREKAIQKILDAYREDVNKITQYYKDNVDLVKHYEHMSGDMAEMVRLNTAAWQDLTSFLKNKIPCYQMIRSLSLLPQERGIE